MTILWQLYLLSFVCCLLFVVCCLLFVVCCLLFVVCCLLFVVCCLLFVVCCLLFLFLFCFCFLFFVFCFLFFVFCIFVFCIFVLYHNESISTLKFKSRNYLTCFRHHLNTTRFGTRMQWIKRSERHRAHTCCSPWYWRPMSSLPGSLALHRPHREPCFLVCW